MSQPATVQSYVEPRINTLGVTRTDGDGVPHFDVTFATFMHDANECYPLLGEMLRGLKYLATRSDNPVLAGRVAHIEFIWNRRTKCRGAVFFDDRGVALIHVVNALLGYQGAGSALSRRIMMGFGVDAEVFDEINELVTNEDYIVVLTRGEAHVEVDGALHHIP